VIESGPQHLEAGGWRPEPLHDTGVVLEAAVLQADKLESCSRRTQRASGGQEGDPFLSGT
jgi:hypothetical protein